jgi:DNA replication protein DnaC
MNRRTDADNKTKHFATIDRLVHHATILEMNVESYRRKAALKRKRGSAD